MKQGKDMDNHLNETLKLTCCTQRFDERSIVMTLKDTQDGSELTGSAYELYQNKDIESKLAKHDFGTLAFYAGVSLCEKQEEQNQAIRSGNMAVKRNLPCAKHPAKK